MGTGLLESGPGGLPVDPGFLGPDGPGSGPAPVPARPTPQRRVGAERSGPLPRLDLVARDMGLAGQSLRLAARFLDAVPGRLGLGPPSLPLDPQRLSLQ